MNQSQSNIQKSGRGRAEGFTLIELLVVIAIIGLLAAILFPVFARARENARRTSCLSNMKQWGTAVTMYAQDWDEKFPAAYRYNDGAPTAPQSWLQVSLPYTKSVQLAVCPSFSYVPGYEASIFPKESYTTVLTEGPAGKHLGLITNPSETIFGWENSKVTQAIYCDGFYCGYSLGPVVSALNTEKEKLTHFGGINVFYVDGHAKWKQTFQVADFYVP